MSATPFLLFPWQRPFLSDLKAVISRFGHPGQAALVIVPNNRPRRYLYQLYAADKKACLLPKVITLADLIQQWAGAVLGSRHQAAMLDRAALLHVCVQEIAHDDARLAGRFARMDMAEFLPWGLRLAALLEEMFLHGLTPTDLAHAEMEVAPAAALLLGALGRISQSYTNALTQHDWSTPGLDSWQVAARSGDIPASLLPRPDRPVFVAGFHLLTHSEEQILHALWKAGAHICLHTDPALAYGQPVHRACTEHADWLKRWKAHASLIQEAHVPDGKPAYTFFAGYDCHSQLLAMRDLLLETADSQASTAIVLTSNSLLLPVLHHLPFKDVNISMGYPLARSPLYRLIESVFSLAQSRSDDGHYHWRSLLQTLRHPYLNRMYVEDSTGECHFLRDALRLCIQRILRGNRYVDVPLLADEVSPLLPPPMQQLFADCLEVMVHAPSMATSTGQTAVCLGRICDFLLTHGGEMWQSFPLDAEAMFRLVRHVIPMLRDCLLAAMPFPQGELQTVLRHVLEAERVPFEADPLTGLQVLGMLETRLLHFDRLLILDATDDRLPGNPAQDPLISDSLRALLGLPDARRRERAAAHTLHRLCAGASEVHFFWQEGISRSALFDGKKSRSRFLEELLWQEEQSRGELLRPGQGPLQMAPYHVFAERPVPRGLLRSEALDQAIAELLQKPLSASLLDSYLRCPLAFVWQRLCRLEAAQEVNEGDDHAGVGICLHETLRLLYEPWLHRDVRSHDITMEDVRSCFASALEATSLRQQLPAASWLMLESAVPFRLQRFLAAQPELVRILALEQKIQVSLSLGGKRYTFTGQIDRLDRRDGRLHILDYKTGHIPRLDGSLWTDTEFFNRIASGLEDLQAIPPLFEELRQRLPSLQLPCYISMLRAKRMGEVGDAALVDLRDSGKEMPLFGGLQDEDIAMATEFCDLSLALLLRHMETVTSFEARPDTHCQWCSCQPICQA